MVARVVDVAPDDLGVRLRALRGPGRPVEDDLAPLPLRAVRLPDGTLEVVDGFKRLERWRAEGAASVPVVVEALDPPGAKRALLLANAPRRTLSPLDEARVITSLDRDDGLSPSAIGRLLGRKRSWVSKRLTLFQHLAPALHPLVDRGRLGLQVALALCRLAPADQRRLARVVTARSLSSRQALALIDAFTTLEDEAARKALLRDPLPVIDGPARSPSPLRPLGQRLEGVLARIERALTDLDRFDLPPGDALTDGERRFLEARLLGVASLATHAAARLAERFPALSFLTQKKKGDLHGSGDRAGDPAFAPRGRRHPTDRETPQDGPQDRTPRAASSRPADRSQRPHRRDAADTVQARPVQGPGSREGAGGAFVAPDPARDPGAGLHRRTDDPGRVPARGARPAPEALGLPPLRDRAGRGGAGGLVAVPRRGPVW